MNRCLAALAAFLPAAALCAEVQVMISAGFYGVYSEMAPALRARERAQARDDARPVDGRFSESIPTRLARGEGADVIIMDGHAADALAANGRRARRYPGRARALAGRHGGAGGSAQAGHFHRRGPEEHASRGKVDRVFGQRQRNLPVDQAFPQLGIAGADRGQEPQGSRTRIRRAGRRGGRARGSGDRVPAGERADPCSGSRLRGALPAELQPGFAFAGAVTANAKQPEAAGALLKFLASPDVAPVLVKKGLAPPAGR
jgi:molybdate transport system substrate-binding protein